MTGTDTGIGKTVTACALVRALRARGLDAGAMKPIETGVGATGPLDAIALRDAAGGADPLDDVCPQRFAMPAAPTVAAEADGREVDLRVVRGAYRRLVASHSLLTLEAAAARNLPVSGVVISHCSRALSDPDRANLEALLHQRAGEQLDVGFGVGGRRGKRHEHGCRAEPWESRAVAPPGAL